MHMSISFSILQVIVIEQSILSLLDCITTKCTCEITKRHYEIPLFLFCGTKYKRIRDDGNSYMLFFFLVKIFASWNRNDFILLCFLCRIKWIKFSHQEYFHKWNNRKQHAMFILGNWTLLPCLVLEENFLLLLLLKC